MNKLLIISKLQQLNFILKQDIEKAKKSLAFWQEQDEEDTPKMIELVYDRLARLQKELKENQEIIEKLRDEIYTNNYFKSS